MSENNEIIWFVYDGECPICKLAAQSLRIRKAVGNLELVNAREDKEHPLIKEINEKGFNLDEGQIIKYQDKLYHGADALNMMALLGSGSGWFNRMNAILFRSKTVSAICYPLFKNLRYLLLKILGIPLLDNLKSHSEQPIFKPIFGDSWDKLPPVFHKHYANRPYSNDIATLEGTMDISYSWWSRLMLPLFRLFKTLVPYQGTDIPTTVRFKSDIDTRKFHYDRQFNFPDREPYYFRSYMIQIKDNTVVEFMRFGIGWKAKFEWNGEKVILNHAGYVWKVFGLMIPMPISLILGKGYAEEVAISDNEFKMRMDITHFLLGKVFEYSGRFKC